MAEIEVNWQSAKFYYSEIKLIYSIFIVIGVQKLQRICIPEWKEEGNTWECLVNLLEQKQSDIITNA